MALHLNYTIHLNLPLTGNFVQFYFLQKKVKVQLMKNGGGKIVLRL